MKNYTIRKIKVKAGSYPWEAISEEEKKKVKSAGGGYFVTEEDWLDDDYLVVFSLGEFFEKEKIMESEEIIVIAGNK